MFIIEIGIIEVEEIDIQGNNFLLDDIEFNEPFVSVEKIEKDTNSLVVKVLESEKSEPDSNILFVSIESWKLKTPLLSLIIIAMRSVNGPKGF